MQRSRSKKKMDPVLHRKVLKIDSMLFGFEKIPKEKK
jgi:hypothetical protein